VNGRIRHLAVVISLAALAGLIPAPPSSRAAQTAPPQAGVVVRFGDGSVRTACVDLGEDGTATGEQVLRDAGLDVTITFEPGAGAAVCKIEQEGCDYPREGCFCQCTLAPGQPCRYWSYYHLGPNGWIFANQGSSTYTVRAGAVEGWSWGPGGIGQGVEPPLLSFSDICSVAAPEAPTATPSATATPTPSAAATASATIAPTATPQPAGAAPTPMIMPVASRTPPPPPPTQPARTATPTNTATPAPTDTALPTPTAAPTDIPPPTAILAAQAPTANTPTPDVPTETPTLPPAATATLAPAGGAAATATAAPLRLPMVAGGAAPRAPVAEATPVQRADVLPTAGALPSGAAAAAAQASNNGGALWFLTLSTALAAGIVLARQRRRR
jgi:hypothetical protein